MTLIKTSLLNGIAVTFKMATLLGINKILAIYVGPAGYAVIGQFQNVVQMITTFASGAVSTGVTKYTAEYHEEVHQQHEIWRTAFKIAFIGSFSTSTLIVIFNQILAKVFLKNSDFGGVFIWFACTLFLFVTNALLLSILNGKKEIIKYVTANIAGSVFTLIVTAFMASKCGLYGALIALAVNQSLTFFVTFFLCVKAKWFKFAYFLGRIDRKSAFNLAKYTAMALTSAVCIPISHIFIRNHLGNTLGWEAAGFWEAMWRLSTAYLMVVTMTLTVYYLPRMSELQNPGEIKKEIVEGFKIILPFVVFCSITIYYFRDTIIGVLYTDDFNSMRTLFGWQMVGDTLKISSWILGYVLTAKAMVKLFILSEIFFSLAFFLFVYFFTQKMGLKGAAFAHFLNYGCHFLFTYFALLKIGMLNDAGFQKNAK